MREHQPDPKVEAAVNELKGIVKQSYPNATFDVYQGEDPEGTYLRATVDIEDTDDVMDKVIDRLLEIQVDEALPVYLIPVRPIERVLEELDKPRRKLRSRIEVEEGRLAL